MTRKDYALLSNAIRPAWRPLDADVVRDLVSVMADAMKSENPNFNKGLFLLACGFNS